MTKVNGADSSVTVPLELHDLLFKADRPRPIDRYIDYFGTAGPSGDGGRGGNMSTVERDW